MPQSLWVRLRSEPGRDLFPESIQSLILACYVRL
jgi:hypothetical protein